MASDRDEFSNASDGIAGRLLRPGGEYPPPSGRLFIRLLPVWAAMLLLLCNRSVQAQSVLDESDEIVYIDSNGYIRVLDPFQTGDNPTVQWRSPDGGWYDAAVGDFNNDGDDEIAAIGAWKDDAGVKMTRLIVYDPVVASGEVNPSQRINGIGWDTLYSEIVPSLLGDPFGIAVGQFSDTGVTDGIVVGTVLPDVEGDDRTPSRVTLLSATSEDGRDWETRFFRDFRNEWALVRAGNPDNVGLDEVVLIDEGLSALAVYRIENGMNDSEDRIFINGSESKEWNDAIVAHSWEQFNQLVGVRNAPVPLDSFIVFQYQNFDDEWIDLYAESFVPPPLRLFSADINGSGDDEVFLLREVPSDNLVQPRLFMRHLGFDTVNPFEVTLDPDNGFRVGAGGDVYGNDGGKDEVIVIRDNFIRIYTEPEINQNHQDFGRTTNVRTVVVGDLDAIGHVPQPVLGASPESLSRSIDRGQTGGPYLIELLNVASDAPIPFSYTVRGNPAWITVDATSDRTPATLSVYLDATKLLSGDYGTAIEIEAESDDVVETDLSIPVTLKVEPALVAVPDIALFANESCEDEPSPRSQEIRVLGPNGQTVTAKIVATMSSSESPPWATVAPTAFELPAVTVVTVDPTERKADFEEALLILEESEAGGLKQTVQIYLVCASEHIYLPIIANYSDSD